MSFLKLGRCLCLGGGNDEAGPSGATGNGRNNPCTYTFRKLQKATKNFSPDKHIGEGGSAHVYKGELRSGQIVAVKKLKPASDRNVDYDLEVGKLSRLNHPNIINLIGCCAEGDERLIVYEFMPLGSLYEQLHARKRGQQPLDWNTRMKIAAGVAKGLNYLHTQVNPPIIYTDLKPSNVLLGDGYHPKISDFGIAKSAPSGNHSAVTTTTVVGTPPYRAPEHDLAHRLSFKSDVYSFGVVLLEIIIGNVPLNDKYGCYVADRVRNEANFLKLADRELQGQFPQDMLKRAMKLAVACTNLRPASRPDMSDAVRALNFLTSDPDAGAWPAEFTLEADASSSHQRNTENEPLTYTFRELQEATEDFSRDKHIGEGGHAHVYKGELRSGEIVAVKKLKSEPDRNEDYNLEVALLSRLNHPNIIKLIGCCAEGDERLIVYEFMAMGSLYSQLKARGQQSLDWNTRMKIAADAAEGLNYLHTQANPPIIYRDLKSHNILVSHNLTAKISDFGSAYSEDYPNRADVKMGTWPYMSPDGELLTQVDIYHFGVVLWEIIMGEVLVDEDKGTVSNEVNPDRELRGQFPQDMLTRAVKVATTCMNRIADQRPCISIVVRAMKYLTEDPDAGDWPAEFAL